MRKRLALAQIRQYGDPVLRMRANEVETFDDELQRVAERMIALMHDADGIGLAATQVGILRRLFVFTRRRRGPRARQPRDHEARATELETDEEGCLSLGAVRVPVERNVGRHDRGARTSSGEHVTFELEGISARVVQHELDHLDGTLMLDRTDAQSRREALRRAAAEARAHEVGARGAGSPSPRRRRSGPTCSSGSRARTTWRPC